MSNEQKSVLTGCGFLLGLLLVLWTEPALSDPATTEAEPPGGSAEFGLPDLDKNARLDDYLAYAALSNPGLAAAFQRFQASFETIEQVQTLPDPKLSYAYFLETVETRVGPQRQKIGVSQALPWLSKLRLRGDIASEATHAAEQRYEAVKVKLFFEVKDAYYELYYLGRAVAITEDNISLLKYLERVAQAEFKGGAPISGVIKAQLELGKLDDRLRSLQALRDPIVARLNAVLGRRADAPVSWPRQAPIRQLEITDSAVLEEMAAHNPELRRLDFEIARDGHAVELARKQFRPDFAVGLDWVDTGDALAPGLSDSGKDPLVAMVSVSLPIWRSKLRAGVREAERRREASRNSRDDLENTLDSRLAMALFRLRDAERKIDLYRDTLVPLAEASLAVTQEGYEAGKGDFLDVIDAQRLLLELQLAFERSVADHEQRIAELEMLVGRPLPAAPVQDLQATSGAHR